MGETLDGGEKAVTIREKMNELGDCHGCINAGAKNGRRICMLRMDGRCARDPGGDIPRAFQKYGIEICEHCDFHTSDGRCLYVAGCAKK